MNSLLYRYQHEKQYFKTGLGRLDYIKEGRRLILVRNFEDFLGECIWDGGCCFTVSNFRQIVGLAQVGQYHMLQILMNDLLEQFCRVFVCEMSLVGTNPLLQRWRIGTISQ